MERGEHWDRLFRRRADHEVNWYQPHLNLSLELLERLEARPDVPLIDVGGGTATLVDDLLERGFSAVTVLDVSEVALARTRHRLGPRSEQVTWLHGDITELGPELAEAHHAIWHDRALFHFLTEPRDRRRYVEALRRALRPGGHAVIATFAEDGPSHCSGLDARRYSTDQLMATVGRGFELVDSVKEQHQTPRGGIQRYRYTVLRRQ